MKKPTMLSLFDGSGAFPLAGAMNGITPVYASEIELYPIAVSHLHFPDMKHLGSVTDVNGGRIEPVDVVTFGSPCQDLSVAGLQKGIHDGERSNLFFEAIRIIREMREVTNGKYPRYAVFENVTGAFSSNNGSDFQAVLQAFCDVCGERLPVPKPERWSNAGFIRGDGYSVAWRILDAQYWGVPQRRKRIYLVADFGSERAGEILFEPESVRGDTAPSGTAREGTTDNVEGSAGGSCGAFCAGASPLARSIGYDESVSPTLKSANAGLSMHAVVYAIDSLSSNSMKSNNPHSGFHEETVAKCLDTTDTNPSKNQGGNLIVYPNTVGALCARADSSPCVDRGQPFVAFHCQQDPITDDKVSPCIGGQSQATVGVCAVRERKPEG